MSINSKVVVITGSSRGIGFGLAERFLEKGNKVVITGTSENSVNKAEDELKMYSTKMMSVVCNVTDKDSINKLVKEVDGKFGRIDIWINNAGVNHSTNSIMELDENEINNVINVNAFGVINGSRAIGKYMLNQGHGAIYNMEGLGSDGRIVNGSDYYGMTKRMVRYFTRCLAKEFNNTDVIIGRLSPGMVLTDFLLKGIDNSPNKESTLKIYRILADKVPVVTDYLCKKILDNKKNGAYIAWLTNSKILIRFLTAPITKRDPMK